MRLPVVLVLAALAARADFYVSPAGDDSNDGSESAPFATLERARDAVRVSQQAGVTVWLRQGTYPITRTLVNFFLNAGEQTTYESQVSPSPGVKQVTVGAQRTGEDLNPPGIPTSRP